MTFAVAQTQIRTRRNPAAAVLRAAVERDLLLRAVAVRESLRQTGESFQAMTYADGVLIVSATDTHRDLVGKVDELLG